MTETDVDYRRDPSQSAEGSGRALARRDAFVDRVDEDVLVAAYPGQGTTPDELTELVRDDIADDALQDSELVGFWVAWHLAGGFSALERAGWHRATVFRKIKAFRSRYGTHPDDYAFSWITLDLERAWREQISSLVAYHHESGI